MKKNKTLHGAVTYRYVQMGIWQVNNILKAAGCVRAKALCRHEEESSNCKFSCITEDDTTPFMVTLGNALGVTVKDLSWVYDSMIGIVFD